MASAKQVAGEILDGLPEDCSLQDILYHLSVRQIDRRRTKGHPGGPVLHSGADRAGPRPVARPVIWSPHARMRAGPLFHFPVPPGLA